MRLVPVHRPDLGSRASGEPTIAIDMGIPRSTAMGWLRNRGPTVVTFPMLEATDFELHREVIELRRRLVKLRAVAVIIRLAGCR